MRKFPKKQSYIAVLLKGKNVTAYPNGKKFGQSSNALVHDLIALAVKKASNNIRMSSSAAVIAASFSTAAAVTAATGGNVALGQAAGIVVGTAMCNKLIKRFAKNKNVTVHANGTKEDSKNTKDCKGIKVYKDSKGVYTSNPNKNLDNTKNSESEYEKLEHEKLKELIDKAMLFANKNKKHISAMFRNKKVTAFLNGTLAKPRNRKAVHRVLLSTIARVATSVKTRSSIAIMGSAISTTAAVTTATGANVVVAGAAGVVVASVVCGKIIKHFSKDKDVTAYANGSKTEKGNIELKHKKLKNAVGQNAKDLTLGFKTIYIGYAAGIAAGAAVGTATGNPEVGYIVGMAVGSSVNRYLFNKSKQKTR